MSSRCAPLARDLLLHHGRLLRCGWRTSRSPDRKVLTSEILPAFATSCSTLLWIGVRSYTRGYYELLEAAGSVCWTADKDPAAARWGHPERHLTCDVMQLASGGDAPRFAGVLCNGVFGYGIDGSRRQAAATERLAHIVPRGGWLMLGWNTHCCRDPLAWISAMRLFEPEPLGELPARRAVPGTTHVFDILRRI